MVQSADDGTAFLDDRTTACKVELPCECLDSASDESLTMAGLCRPPTSGPRLSLIGGLGRWAPGLTVAEFSGHWLWFQLCHFRPAPPPYRSPSMLHRKKHAWRAC